MEYPVDTVKAKAMVLEAQRAAVVRSMRGLVKDNYLKAEEGAVKGRLDTAIKNALRNEPLLSMEDFDIEEMVLEILEGIVVEV